MARIKVGVCELAPEIRPGSAEWGSFVESVSRECPDLFLINEMPFGSWISAAPSFERATWEEACRIPEQGLAVLSELGAGVVLGSRPRVLDGRRVNEAFVWTKEQGLRGVHTKQYFPDEEEYYEARWFERGERPFQVAQAGALKVGFLICTEVMFNEHARQYGRRGAQLIAVPRAVGRPSLRRWLVAMRMAAIVSGCYVLSSNRTGVDSKGQRFGGRGWVIDPIGDLVAQTSSSSRVSFHEIDTDVVERAQSQYPCYVKE